MPRCSTLRQIADCDIYTRVLGGFRGVAACAVHLQTTGRFLAGDWLSRRARCSHRRCQDFRSRITHAFANFALKRRLRVALGLTDALPFGKTKGQAGFFILAVVLRVVQTGSQGVGFRPRFALVCKADRSGGRGRTGGRGLP